LNPFVCSCNVQGYSQVFDIISLELFWYGGKVDPKLEGNLRRFFTENDLLQTWSKVSRVVYVLYVIYMFIFQEAGRGYLMYSSHILFTTLLTGHLEFAVVGVR